MHTIGIVSEYNPFHTGHAYQITESKRLLGADCAVVAVMSGNWVQSADCAVLDKWIRARLALLGGVDLVLELPTLWAMSSSEFFARGAIDLLDATGVVDILSFGSECGDVDTLQQVARCLDTPSYQLAVHRLSKGEMSFATARQTAVRKLMGEEPAALLSSPNNNLGVEYLRALNIRQSAIRPMTVRREGAPHNSLFRAGERPAFLSATQIRRDLRSGSWNQIEAYLIPGTRQLLKNSVSGVALLSRAERAVLARIRTMTAQEWAMLPDSGTAEGLPQRLERAGHQCRSLEEFLNLAKTKRFTRARLRRLILWAYLGLVQADRPHHPPYLRVLAFNRRGQELLRDMKRRAVLPIVTKPAHARALDTPGRHLFVLESRCTDLYDLCLEQVPAPGREWTTNPIIITPRGDL